MLKEKQFTPAPLPEAPKDPEAPAPQKSEAPPTKRPRDIVPAGDPVESGKPMGVENPGFVTRKVPLATTCAQCGTRTNRAPGAMPFSSGPYKGGFLCPDCWTLYWDEHPELLGDAKSRAGVAEEARRIRLKRAGEGSKLLFEQDGNRAFLTPRGTVIIDLKRMPFGGADEFDEARLKALGDLLAGVQARVESEPEADAPKSA